MFIFLIGYLYVITMIAVGTGSVIKGGSIFLFLGLLPTWLLVILWRSKQVRRKQQAGETNQ